MMTILKQWWFHLPNHGFNRDLNRRETVEFHSSDGSPSTVSSPLPLEVPGRAMSRRHSRKSKKAKRTHEGTLNAQKTHTHGFWLYKHGYEDVTLYRP